MKNLALTVFLGSMLAISGAAFATKPDIPVCGKGAVCSLSLEQAIAVKESYEPSFFAIPGIHAVGITLCDMKPKIVSVQKYCITVAGEDQFSYDSFLEMYPTLEVGSLPIKLTISEMAEPQPGVVVSD